MSERSDAGARTARGHSATTPGGDGTPDHAHDRIPLTPDELLSTTRTVRRRLDLTRAVPRSLVEDCLRLAFQAPTGANAQNWGWVVVDDPTLRAEMARIYRAAADDHLNRCGPRIDPPHLSGAAATTAPGANDLGAKLPDVPVLVVPTYQFRYGTQSTYAQASGWGSILPAVWSFMLALRSRGLGSAWTTVHLHREWEMADLLGIPAENTQAGLFPVAHTIGTSFRPADRAFSERRVFWNGWGRAAADIAEPSEEGTT